MSPAARVADEAIAVSGEPGRFSRRWPAGDTVEYRRAGAGDPVIYLAAAGGSADPAPGVGLLTDRFDVVVMSCACADAGAADVGERARHVARAMAELGLTPGLMVASGEECETAIRLIEALPTALARLVLDSPPTVTPGEVELTRALSTLETPTLVLRGTLDPPGPAVGRYRSLIPDCHDLILYDAAHPLAAARPEAFASAVGDFLLHGERFALGHAPTVINP